MKPELLDLICCPQCGAESRFATNESEPERSRAVGSSARRRSRSRLSDPGVRPRFVESDDYADAFALEWNAFRTAHLDSFTGLDYLDRQLQDFLGLPDRGPRREGGSRRWLRARALLGNRVEPRGTVVAVDLSGAIDAAFENLNSGTVSTLCRRTSSGFRFAPRPSTSSIAGGFCAHTPDPPAAFEKLPPLVRPGGKVMTMVYANYNKAYLTTTELYRRLTTRMPKRILLKLCSTSRCPYYVGQIPGVGPLITRLLLPGERSSTDPSLASGEYVLDLYSPKYAFTYNHVDVHGWYERAGLEVIRPVGAESGVGYIATKSPAGDDTWGERA